MFEIVVTVISLLTFQKAQYVSIQKFDTMEHCEAETKKLDPIIVKKLDKKPFTWEGSCKMFNDI